MCNSYMLHLLDGTTYSLGYSTTGGFHNIKKLTNISHYLEHLMTCILSSHILYTEVF